jgi:Putative adhesin
MMSRRTAGILASGSVCATVAVAVPAACVALDQQYHTTVSYGAGASPVTTLVVNDPSGNVQVTGGADTLSVTEHQSYRDSPPTSRHTVADGTMTLDFRCPSDDCGIDYDVQVPDGVAVQITSTAGDVTLAKLSGGVQVTSGSGDITASGLTGPKARFSDSAGTVLVGFAAVPGSVYADSEAGDVTVFLPGSGSYKVAASSDAGKVHVTVPQSGGSPNTVTAQSDAGDVAVRTQM